MKLTHLTLIETIKNDSLKARKAGDKVEAALLITLASEASMIGKNDGNREPTDKEVGALAQKFLENIELFEGRASTDAMKAKLVIEKSVLARYVPEKTPELPESELRAAILDIGEGLTLKDMGRVLGILNYKFPGQINGKTVNAILRG